MGDVLEDLPRAEDDAGQWILDDVDWELGLLAKEHVDPAEERAPAGHNDAPVDQIGGELGPEVTELVDSDPPAGGTGVAYRLEALIGGSVETTCESAGLNTFRCPAALVCTPDQGTNEVNLSFQPGANLDATGVVVTRNGTEAAVMPVI